MTHMPPVKVLVLVRDLLLRSRVEAAADAASVPVISASSLDRAVAHAAASAPTIVFADLSDANFPAITTARDLRAAAPGVRLIGFASHVDLKSLAAAREAGFDQTLSRSEFTARLPELLKP